MFLCVALLGCGGDEFDDHEPRDEQGDWTYVPLVGARCGNGSQYGVAVNGAPDAQRLVIFLDGGGACWDTNTCFVLNAATFIADTLSPDFVRDRARLLERWLFSRSPNVGPFADAAFVYAPYCTGDLHSGRRVASYQVLAETRDVHHVGAENLDALAQQVSGVFPNVERLWLTGASAGGYGAILNWWRFADALPQARVDVIDDSGPPITVPGERWSAWTSTWSLEVPPDCEDCAQDIAAVVPHFLASMPESRVGILSYDYDPVIASYYGTDLEGTKNGLDGLAVVLADTSSALFRLQGSDHVVLADPYRSSSNGIKAHQWIESLVSGLPTQNAGP
jgi:hypothetical protein